MVENRQALISYETSNHKLNLMSNIFCYIYVITIFHRFYSKRIRTNEPFNQINIQSYRSKKASSISLQCYAPCFIKYELFLYVVSIKNCKNVILHATLLSSMYNILNYAFRDMDNRQFTEIVLIRTFIRHSTFVIRHSRILNYKKNYSQLMIAVLNVFGWRNI